MRARLHVALATSLALVGCEAFGNFEDRQLVTVDASQVGGASQSSAGAGAGTGGGGSSNAGAAASGSSGATGANGGSPATGGNGGALSGGSSGARGLGGVGGAGAGGGVGGTSGVSGSGGVAGAGNSGGASGGAGAAGAAGNAGQQPSAGGGGSAGESGSGGASGANAGGPPVVSDLDTTFGADGVVSIPSLDGKFGEGSLAAILVPSDGSVVLGGTSDGTNVPTLVRLQHDGTFYPGFGDGGSGEIQLPTPQTGSVDGFVDLGQSTMAPAPADLYALLSLREPDGSHDMLVYGLTAAGTFAKYGSIPNYSIALVDFGGDDLPTAFSVEPSGDVGLGGTSDGKAVIAWIPPSGDPSAGAMQAVSTILGAPTSVFFRANDLSGVVDSVPQLFDEVLVTSVFSPGTSLNGMGIGLPDIKKGHWGAALASSLGASDFFLAAPGVTSGMTISAVDSVSGMADTTGLSWTNGTVALDVSALPSDGYAVLPYTDLLSNHQNVGVYVVGAIRTGNTFHYSITKVSFQNGLDSTFASNGTAIVENIMPCAGVTKLVAAGVGIQNEIYVAYSQSIGGKCGWAVARHLP